MAHSVSEYLTLKGEDESAIVTNLLPTAGALNIFGEPKAGKSYLSLQLANAIGDPTIDNFLGFPIKTHGEVLYLQIDTPRNLWIDRVFQLQAKGLAFESVYFTDRQDCPEISFDVFNPSHYAWLKAECQARPYLVIIVDTLREVFDGDENDSNEMKRVVSRLLMATTPAAMILVSHSRKTGKDRPSGISQNQRGSSYVAGRMDALMEVEVGKLTAKSRTMAETLIPVKHNGDTGLFTLDEPHILVAQKVVDSFPGLSSREQAKVLQERLGGAKGIEACRSLLRRIQDK